MECNKDFIKKCEEIFETKIPTVIDKQKLEKYENLIGFSLSPEYLHILENYEGVMLNEGYGFVPKQSSPVANADGYETFNEFVGFDSRYDLFTMYEMYKEQLPLGAVPIAEMEGGDYICLSKDEKIYIWLHEYVEQEGLILANISLEQFILSIEKMPLETVYIDISQIESEYSDDFWD